MITSGSGRVDIGEHDRYTMLAEAGRRRAMSATPLSLPQPPERAPEFGRDALIACESLVRIYQTGSIEVQALQGLDLAVDRGEMVAVVGAPGSGKSTLLSILAGIEPPPRGRASTGGTCWRCPVPTVCTTGGTPSGSSGSRRPPTSCRI
jgi:ABC-type glutathione transport system ATPase component